MLEEKIISEFSGYTFDHMEELSVFEYWLLLRDSVIYNLKQTKEGQEYLEKCWRFDQTEPDREALRLHFEK